MRSERALRGALLALIALLAPLAACAQAAPVEDQWRAIAVEAEPADLGATEIGQLRFLGGLSLRAESPAFGGLSDIHVGADGAFLAITDAGFFVRGVLAFDEAGAPVGVSDVAIAAMRDENGEPFPNKESADSEGMALLPDGRLAVSFEQTQTVRLYDLGAGPFAPGQPGPALAGVEHLPRNGGLEALTLFGADSLLVGAEESGVLWVAPLAGAEPAPPAATLRDLPVGYGLVELDALPDGDVIALQRFYAPVIGNRIRVLRLSLVGQAVEATELARLARPLQIDNFEGVSVVRRGQRTRLYLVSDDNFSASQRTLLYAFELVEERQATPAP